MPVTVALVSYSKQRKAAGESAQLQVGDRILLLATQLDQFLEVTDLAEASGDETIQLPLHKR